jgi:acyl carrier protein
MSSTAEQIDDVILSLLRRRLPELEAADLEKGIYDIDVDSLDVVDLTHELETQFKVKADLDVISDLGNWPGFRSYIADLIAAT